ARFVRFVEDDGKVLYYATYTAYNGFTVLPQLIETHDFRYFKIITLNGRCVQNKGMALFPRKIDGEYRMISRLDGGNLYIMSSDNLHFWNEAALLHWEAEPWEFVQVGNCGSPLETKEGWLLLTHGVGPMRQYCIGAALLDLHDPSRLIAHLREPLITPEDSERDGYVPNVVYSCGAMIHGDELIIPYAKSDTCTGMATVSLRKLLAHLTQRA
ncbi:MAG: glycosidase, partial [Dehalococcoidia bacterium]